MENFRILNVIPQNEESCRAIVEVMAYLKNGSQMVTRYKIVPRKDGSGSFPSVANVKIVEDNQERWAPGFMLDSNYERDELQREIMHAYKSQPKAQSTQNTRGYVNVQTYQQNTATAPQNAPSEESLPF